MRQCAIGSFLLLAHAAGGWGGRDSVREDIKGIVEAKAKDLRGAIAYLDRYITLTPPRATTSIADAWYGHGDSVTLAILSGLMAASSCA